MTENLKALIEKVSADEELKKKAEALNEIKDENEVKAAVIKLAEEAGVTLTEADLVPENDEVSEDELDAVAGGRSYGCHCVITGIAVSEPRCTCFVVGKGDMEL
jgi:predicted ribosomally synthesized peptide with nif11-like leader